MNISGILLNVMDTLTEAMKKGDWDTVLTTLQAIMDMVKEMIAKRGSGKIREFKTKITRINQTITKISRG